MLVQSNIPCFLEKVSMLNDGVSNVFEIYGGKGQNQAEGHDIIKLLYGLKQGHRQ